jgi:hypothetical protein
MANLTSTDVVIIELFDNPLYEYKISGYQKAPFPGAGK